MRVLWTHNFNPAIPNKGVFVHTLAEGVRAARVDLHLEYLGDLRSLRQLRRARERVRYMAREFDLVHAQYGSACALVTAAVSGVPKVLTVRGSDWNIHPRLLSYACVHTALASTFTKVAISSYDCVVSVSKRMARAISRFTPNDVVVLPDPIDLHRFVPLDKKEAKAQLGFPECQEKWVLFNSLDLDNPVKRFPLAKEAFEQARQRVANLRLRLGTALPHTAMPLFVGACDLILSTSENEGWPNAIKEALACNVPFVATDVSDLKEIAELEPSCRICPPDPAAIARAICDTLSQPPATDLRRHVQHMSLETISRQLIATYALVLSRYSGSQMPRQTGS